MRLRRAIAFVCGIILVLGPFLAITGDALFAQTKDELEGQIDNLTKRSTEIEREIARLEFQLLQVGAEKSTLQKAINQLELERKKVQADIARTQNLIGATDLEISKLGLEIEDTKGSIEQNKRAIMEILRRLQETESDALIVSLLRYDNLSDFWNVIVELEEVRDNLGKKVKNLIAQNAVLSDQRLTSKEKREKLVELREQYADQNTVLTNNKAEKDQLLKETQNEEALYQQRLAEQKAAYEKLQQELRAYESQLQFLLDPNSIPQKGTAVFDWPLANIVITQYFGGTEFAARNPSIYGGRPYHPGVDLSAPVGTKIYAPLSGTVRATGDTGAEAPGCLSWGKWTLVDHANGLATLYAHQSVISVSPGQSINTNDIIGYTGNTGYTTGPHLHLTVYAKEGVSIKRFSEIKSVTSCGSARTPVAATGAYLDPMDYLPSL